MAVLVAPDNAEHAVIEHLDAANESVRVEQVAIGSRDQPFLERTLRAANRGVRVQILLSGAWFVREENLALVRCLNRLSRREGLPLDARLAQPRSPFEKIHAKGVIIDGRTVILGSLNWNNNSARRNREVALVLDGREAGRYFGRVFPADWHGGAWGVTVGLAVAVPVVAVGVWRLAAVLIRFEGRSRADRGPVASGRRRD